MPPSGVVPGSLSVGAEGVSVGVGFTVGVGVGVGVGVAVGFGVAVASGVALGEGVGFFCSSYSSLRSPKMLVGLPITGQSKALYSRFACRGCITLLHICPAGLE